MPTGFEPTTSFRPLLDIASDGREHCLQEEYGKIASILKLNKKDLSEKLESRPDAKFKNRIAWAKFYLVKANALKSPRVGHFRITKRGLDLLNSCDNIINVNALKEYEEFRAFIKRSRKKC